MRSAADLDQPGRVIAVKNGTTGHHYAATALRRPRVLVLDKESAAVLEVTQGKADAFIYDSLSVYRQHVRHPGTTRAILVPFKEEAWAVALRPEDPDLRRAIDGFLEAFRADGGFERLGDEFLPEEKRYFRTNGIPFYF